MSFYVKENSNHLPILYIQDKPFHSLRDPYKDTRLIQVVPTAESYFLIGIGLGYVLEAFREIISQRSIRIIVFFQFQEERELFWKYASFLKLDVLVEKTFLLSEKKAWSSFLNELNLSQSKVWSHPYYHALMEDTPLERSYFELQQYIKQSLMNQITDIAFGFRWWRNFLHNYSTQKIHIFSKPLQVGDFSILLVGSGFSSYQYKNRIQEVREYTIIIAIPPVLDLLFNIEVIPDIIVMTDGGVANRFYLTLKNPQFKDTIFIVYPHIYSQVLKWFPGKIYMINGGLEPETILTPELEYFPSGGSVASTALDIAMSLSKNIWTIGFDFAYTNHHPHYPGSPLESQKFFVGHRFSPPETGFSLQVLLRSVEYKNNKTTPVLKAYQEYFQKQIENATQKGYQIQKLAFFHHTVALKGQKEVISLQDRDIKTHLKKERLQSLKDILQNAIKNKNYQHPIFNILLAKIKAKNGNIAEVLEKEQNFLENLLLQIEEGP